jgi:hypothetical protein
LVDEVGLPSLVGDLVRVEERLQGAVAQDDRFLGDVAGHLLAAGGKRLRPMLTLCAGYAAAGMQNPVPPAVVTGGASVELVHLGSLYHDDVIDEPERVDDRVDQEVTDDEEPQSQEIERQMSPREAGRSNGGELDI